MRAISAHQKYPATPLTDEAPEVWHIVTTDAGTEHTISASCPATAISKFNKMLENKKGQGGTNGSTK